jgi:hypothetical protein
METIITKEVLKLMNDNGYLNTKGKDTLINLMEEEK